ncbi:MULTISPECIES: hypothetical protein [Lysobacteraceae]|uniref:hypothetical protein n=1 Tax=Lysobacteraceae TaxID=32033 RepID=UPI000C151F4C|nr:MULTISPECIES: hypothetical protein [Xanthomonadaceae]MBH1714571.1 hypothetical protein [Stenotrophomonas maltophilia]MBN7830692.1 hypothetical protein [Stenotrophomonas maltophilia]MBN7834919.1 hypothetical protein [Stenotrophomonas maltophilia]MBN7858819.1 hypothetical protein [Stenotrophomonas maltophilia]MBN7918269.1 hypothetical protein [Stenotrophomonas maltophilia]
MSVSVHKDAPHLKVCEGNPESGTTPYIAFEEYLTIPGLEDADIRLEFANKPSLEEVEELRRRLKSAGLVFVVQRRP